jgi:uncharacterized protein (UPF0276 family)
MHEVEHLGVGLGLRNELCAELETARGKVDFLEVITESCFRGMQPSPLRKLCQQFPVVCHGINLSLAADEPMDPVYLSELYAVLSAYRPRWFSDHLAMTHVGGIDIGHLAPFSFTEETVATVVQKVRTLQAEAQLLMLVENIAYYFQTPGCELAEHEFLTRVVEQADCGLLLDLNNLVANARNQNYDPFAFLDRLPLERVVQVHLAGGVWRSGVFVDTHAHPVGEDVWRLLEYVCRRASIKGVLLERDANIPALNELVDELDHARAVLRA